MLYLQHNSLRLNNTILKGPVHHLLITHHFHRNCQTHSLHRVLYDQPGHLLPDRQDPEDQPARLGNMTTDHSGSRTFRSVFIHPCCSSYRLASSLIQSNPVVHILDVWLQSRLVRGRRDRSTLDLKMSLLSSPT